MVFLFSDVGAKNVSPVRVFFVCAKEYLFVWCVLCCRGEKFFARMRGFSSVRRVSRRTKEKFSFY